MGEGVRPASLQGAVHYERWVSACPGLEPHVTRRAQSLYCALRETCSFAPRGAFSYAPSAPRTRSGANGSSCSRTPVKAAIALPTAPANTGRPSSPPPEGGLLVDTTLT